MIIGFAAPAAAAAAAAAAMRLPLPGAHSAPPASQRGKVGTRDDDAELDVRQQDKLHQLDHAALVEGVERVEAPQQHVLP